MFGIYICVISEKINVYDSSIWQMIRSGDMSDQKPPKREFNPRSHAMIYLMAIVYLAYLIFQMVKGYLAGGPDAPSFALLAGGVALLGGGCILLGILAWKMSAMAPKEEDQADGSEQAGEDRSGNEEKES